MSNVCTWVQIQENRVERESKMENSKKKGKKREQLEWQRDIKSDIEILPIGPLSPNKAAAILDSHRSYDFI